MDANEWKAIEHIIQGQRQIKAGVVFLSERYGREIIAQCELYVDSATAKTLAEQVIEEAVKKLGNYTGDDLSAPLYKAANVMAKAKRASMLPDLLKADQENQEQKGKTIKEREDNALIRFRKIGLPFKQIAEFMGMTEGQARVRYHRALLSRPEIKNVRRT